MKSEYGSPVLVAIAGHLLDVFRSPKKSRFAEVDILGMDFLVKFNVSLWYNSPQRRAKLYFGGESQWEVKPKM